TVNGAGATGFGGAVGGTSHLNNLTSNGAGSTAINGGAVTTDVDQNYNNAVTLGANDVLTGRNITFALTVDGAQALTVNTNSGNTTFGGAVGFTTPLSSVTTNADGATRINGGSVSTSGDQTYNDIVTLGADTTISAGNVLFNLTLDSFDATARDLTVNSGGFTAFAGIVGGGRKLKN